MRLLALETSTEYCSCALSVDGVVRASHVLAGQSHSDLLLPTVARLMAEADIGFGQLDAVAFGAGPGSFTGLRIACGAAQGLAFAHDLPVVPVASLEALAEAVRKTSPTEVAAAATNHATGAHAATRVITAFDARMGELYLAAYEWDGADWRVLLAPLLARPEALPDLPPHADWVGAGSGFATCGAAFNARYAPARIDARCVPRAGEVASIALRKLARGETVAAESAAPLYVRDKVALNVQEQAALRTANAANAIGAGNTQPGKRTQRGAAAA